MKISSTNVNIAVNAVAVAAEKIVLMRRKGSSPGKRLGKPTRVRQRVSVNSGNLLLMLSMLTLILK